MSNNMGIASLLKSKISTNEDNNLSDIKDIIEKKKQELEKQVKKEVVRKKKSKASAQSQLKYLKQKDEEGFHQCPLFIDKRIIVLIDKEIKNNKSFTKKTRSDIINKILLENYKNEIQ